MTNLSRRDFLKVGSSLSMSAWLAASRSPWRNALKRSNVLFLVFDTMSARHLSLYGYARETTPNLKRFADRATVYHSHYSTANFTSPSTASLFLGMYPWKHRAHTQAGLARRDLVRKNLFALYGETFLRIAFAQTEFADILMNQFARSIDRHIPASAFSLSQEHLPINEVPWEPLLSVYAPKTLLGAYVNLLDQIQVSDLYSAGVPEYPKGLPNIPGNRIAFRLTDVFSGLLEEIQNAELDARPQVSYFHLYPPHSPYNPGRKFLELFQDDYKPLRKPDHPLSRQDKTYRNMVPYMQRYDQFIAQVDHEFGLLLDALENRGLLQNTYIVVTSDHGELFERGTTGHSGPFLFDSVIHIPLLIRAPGQTRRLDIDTLTSNVDLLPTLVSLCGVQPPADIDGALLPGFGGQEDPNRLLYSMYSAESSAFGPLRKGTFAIQQGADKLIYYRGYQEYPEAFELYNIHDDPDEIKNLVAINPSVAGRLKEQLLDALSRADEPYT